MTRGKKAKTQHKPARKKAAAKRASAKTKKAAPKTRAKKPVVKRRSTAPRLGAGIAPFVEELEVALDELRRLSTELVSTRRELNDEWSSGRGIEGALRTQLEAMRVELKTARAELEIAQAGTQRMTSQLEAAAEAEVRARQAQREAEHAADRGRDELLWARRELDKKPEAPRSTGDEEK
ncbi:MAG: hypothetical protein ABI321_23915 [Polyangia bacterium]